MTAPGPRGSLPPMRLRATIHFVEERSIASTAARRVGRRLRRRLATALMATGLLSLAGCPRTVFYDEGPGQPSDRASGKAPPGSVGACKVPDTARPVLVDEQLWRNLDPCNKRTPRRYLRIGYRPDAVDASGVARKQLILEGLEAASKEDAGNIKMVTMLRTIRRIAEQDEYLKSRVERASGRSQPCDYAYLFSTTREHYEKVGDDASGCAAKVFDPKLRRDRCLFDENLPQTRWLTSAWSCLAFTETVGEGSSCYRLCAFDDHCAAQTSCAQPDFDLMLCTLGICMPEAVAGIVPVRR